MLNLEGPKVYIKYLEKIARYDCLFISKRIQEQILDLLKNLKRFYIVLLIYGSYYFDFPPRRISQKARRISPRAIGTMSIISIVLTTSSVITDRVFPECTIT